MSKEILINVDPREKRVVVVNDGRMEEFYVERPQDKTIVGNIYKGKIEAVIPSINGAFVDIGMIKKGFLYLSEAESASESLEIHKPDHPKPAPPKPAPNQSKDDKMFRGIKKGQEVLVQVVKESFGTKGPRLSAEIGIAGRYLVIMPQEEQVGVSRRIEDEDERRRLRGVLQGLKLPKNAGFIVRTAACGKSSNELLRDANFLIKLWMRMEKIIVRQKAPSLIYEEYDLCLRAIRDSFTEDVTKVIVDSKPEFYRIQKFMRTFLGNQLSRRIEFYRGDDLFGEKDIEKQIAKTFETKVYFKNKGYLIIEPTEGLVVIDVNSGGFKEKIRQEEAAFKINCEAAIEAAHQLRLRDLGGIIVIDFIDMEKEGHRREVLKVLKTALGHDRAKYDVLGISKFGLVEMTRERIHNTVQTLASQPCPYCSGKGKVRSPITMAIYAIKELKKFMKGKSLKEVSVTANQMVVDEITKDKENLRLIERKFRVKVNLIPNPSAKIEDIFLS
jgi:ribonuclease G